MTIEFYVSKSLRYTQARRFARLPADFAVHLRTDELRVNDRVTDISEAGMKVHTTKPLTPMSLVSMRLDLPHATEPVDVLGRVMWSSRQMMGIRFEKTDARVTDVVERLRQAYDRI
jgi:hypothetical protein